MNIHPIILLYILSTLSLSTSASTPSSFTIVFKGRVKVNALEKDRAKIQQFFGKTLGRKIEQHDNFDRVHFDGEGFVAFVYHKSETMVLQKADFIKSMQVGLLVPTEQYEAVKKAIKQFGVEAMLPNDERFKDHSTYFYFHAPGNQVFRIVNTADLAVIPNQQLPYDASKAAAYGADEYGMKKYVFAFLKVGPNRGLDSLQTMELQEAHLRNINRLAENGQLVLAGPFFGKGDLRGIYIFNVSTVEEARQLVATDPAIKAGSLQMELLEWYGTAALLEVTSIHKSLEKVPIVN